MALDFEIRQSDRHFLKSTNGTKHIDGMGHYHFLKSTGGIGDSRSRAPSEAGTKTILENLAKKTTIQSNTTMVAIVFYIQKR